MGGLEGRARGTWAPLGSCSSQPGSQTRARLRAGPVLGPREQAAPVTPAHVHDLESRHRNPVSSRGLRNQSRCDSHRGWRLGGLAPPSPLAGKVQSAFSPVPPPSPPRALAHTNRWGLLFLCGFHMLLPAPRRPCWGHRCPVPAPSVVRALVSLPRTPCPHCPWPPWSMRRHVVPV